MKKLCILQKRNINSGRDDNIITAERYFVKVNCGSRGCRRKPGYQLLLAEGHAVGALVNSGIHLVGTHQDLLQGAVVGIIAVVSALFYGAFDAFVGMTAHT